MIKYVLLNFGYAEDANLGFTVFSAEEPGEDSKELFVSLSNFLKEKYLKKFANKVVLKDCCKPYANQQDNFCGKCGNRLFIKDFDFDDFRQWLLQLGVATNDSYGYDEDEPWTPNVPLSDVLRGQISESLIVHEAEHCILAALGFCENGRDIDALFDSVEDNSIFYWR